MVNIIKKNAKLLIGIFIGAVISGGIVYAVTQIPASNVTYSNTTVDQALDSLYMLANSNLSFGTPKFAYSTGNFVSSRTATLSNLSKGKYLIVKIVSSAYSSTSNPSELHNSIPGGGNSGLICSTSSCTLSAVGGYETRKQASTAVTGDSKVNNYVAYTLLLAEISEDDTSITYNYTENTTSNKMVRSISLSAFPIN